MKRLLISSLLVISFFSGCKFRGTWETTGDQFYSGLRSSEEFVAFKIPVRLAGFAVPGLEREARQLLKEVHSIGVLVMNEKAYPGENLKLGSAIHSSFCRRGYMDMMTIHQSGQKIHVNALEEGGKIRELVLIVASEEEFVFIKLKGRITPENFINFANKYQS